MPKYDKYVNALFIAAGIVVWVISRHYIDYGIGYFQLGRRMGASADVVRQLMPIVLGALVFIFLQSVNKWKDFVHDAVSEVIKVSWPTSREVRFGTFIVIVTVLVAGACLGIVDIFLTKAVKVTIGA